MNTIDLVGLLRAKNFLQKVKVYGKLVAETEKPQNFKDNVSVDLENYSFVIVDVFAVDLKEYNGYIGASNPNLVEEDGIYMVNGTMCMYLKRGYSLSSYNCFACSTLMFGQKGYSNYVLGFGFQKINDIFYPIPCNYMSVDASVFTDTLKRRKFQESISTGRIARISSATELPRFYGVMQEIRQIGTETEMPSQKSVYDEQKMSYKVDKFQSREEIKPYSENMRKLEDKLSQTLSIKSDFIKTIKNDYHISRDVSTPLRYMLRGLVGYLKRKPNMYMDTGYKLLVEYLNKFEGASDSYLGTTYKDYLAKSFSDISEFMLDHSKQIMVTDDAYTLVKKAFANNEKFYANMLGQILKIKVDDLEDIVYTCLENDLSFISIVNENPYLLILLGDLKFDSIERIAYAFGLNNKKEIQKFRYIAMLESYIAENEGSTIFRKEDLKNADIGVSLTVAKYQELKDTGSHIKEGMRENINAYLSDASKIQRYDATHFKMNRGKYVEKIETNDIKKAVNDYIATGLGIDLDTYITSTTLAEKESFVYKKMYELGQRKYEYNLTDIERYTDEYEKIVGFKLEKEQRDAVKLLLHGAGVIAGSAGSGKTTVSNCLVYVLEHLEPMVDIQFGAPTGKAAKRMQEVVKRPVRTLHSMFKIGLSKENYFNMEESDASDADVFFFDENAMVTLDVFYSVLKKIDTTQSRVFLFGDFNQLPPIGKGLVFKNLLKFMPCVTLTVSKRAADGSNITYNSNLITNFSDSANFKPLKSGKDFFFIQASEQNITKVTTDLCQYYLGKPVDVSYICSQLNIPELPKVQIEADDIQVVSPLSKPRYSWGTTKLNSVLQPIFNSTRGYNRTIVNKNTYQKEDEEQVFAIGDRVIHTAKNMYSMQWYEPSFQNNTFVRKGGYGICNGEVGKLVGYCKASDVEFIDGGTYDDVDYPENMREDSTYTEPEGYFIIVEYFDYISDSKYYILYRCKLNNTDNKSNKGLTFYGEDFDKLLLFYAGTTHKLQGSQAKVIIAVIGDVNFPRFLTRNMLYTTVTRGQELVFLVGSSSMVTKARYEVADKERLTIGDYF